MGLDMYLEKKTLVKNYEHFIQSQKTNVVVTGCKAKYIKPERISDIIEELIYWRKANQIHAWFIENCADGDENKTKMDVSFDQLVELLAVCKKVEKASKLVKGKIINGYRYENGKEVPIIEDGETIKNPATAKKLLPVSEGFFFGSQQYDCYYLQDIKNTVRDLEAIIKEGDKLGDYQYIASW